MTVAEPAPPSRCRRVVDRLRPTRPQPGPEEQLPWTMPVLGLAVLVLIAGGVLWATLDWLERVAAVRVDPATVINGKDFVTAKLDAVKIALSVVAGGGALFALYLAVRRQRTSERDLRARLDAQAHTEDDARARRVTELYTKAADQLGSDKAPVRLAGLYALERLGQDNPDQRPTIANLWCAYLRMPYALSPASTLVVHASSGVTRPLLRDSYRRIGIRPPSSDSARPDPKAVHAEAVLERDVRLSVQRLLAKHLRPDPDPSGQLHPDFWPEVPELDLTEATLIDLDLSHCHLPSLRMNRASFTGTGWFHEVTFTGDVWFGDATFTSETEFGGATFTGDASFLNVAFTGDTGFVDATFGAGAWFDGVTFTDDTSFGGATFSSNAKFVGATFNGTAMFDGATFNGTAEFDAAIFNGAAMFDDTTFTDTAIFGGRPFIGTFTSFDGTTTFAETTVFGDTTFNGDAMFIDATFNSDAIFGGATFIGNATFIDATFNSDAEFGGVTFTNDATFNGAVFERAANCGRAQARLMGSGSRLCVWPRAWTLDATAPGVDGDVLWGRLVPVPEVLDPESRWADWLPG